MQKPKRWRVRVRRSIEDWVDVKALTKEEAEQQASTMAGVLSVITSMTMSGERPVDGIPPVGVMDEEES